MNFLQVTKSVILALLIAQCESKIQDLIVDCSACSYLPLKTVDSYHCSVSCDIQNGEYKRYISAFNYLPFLTVGRICDKIRKNSVSQWRVEPWPFTIWLSTILLDHQDTWLLLHSPLQGESMSLCVWAQRSHYLPNVTVGWISDMIRKKCVSQWGIKPWPFTNWVSIKPLDP